MLEAIIYKKKEDMHNKMKNNLKDWSREKDRDDTKKNTECMIRISILSPSFKA